MVSTGNASVYRTPLWVSGLVMVVSSLIMAGTSMITNRESNGGIIIKSSSSSFRQLELVISSLFQVSADSSQTDDEIQDMEAIIDDDRLATTGGISAATAETTTKKDLESQWHRRLKRILRPGREREFKAAEARNRAKAIDPARKDNTFIPPFAQNDFKPDIMVFPNPEAEARYSAATELWQDAGFRDMWDPLGVTSNQHSSNATITRVPFEPKVEYLGVLVDAGRQYFPLDWLKRLIVYLHRLRYNMIHFRLTDDQAFNVRLDSYPELAYPSVSSTMSIHWDNETDPTVEGVDGSLKNTKRKYRVEWTANDKVYTLDELRELVAFAKSYGIAMIPEINLPGHAGSWSGIPDLVLNCPEFICEQGYGLPLNVEHPQLKTILTAVIGEVMEIFDNPPLLHLGGDEIYISNKCFAELDREPFDYTKFEELLKDVLNTVGISEDRVLRWEETGIPTLEELKTPKPHRAGTIEQYWFNLPGSKSNKQVKKSNDTIFMSHGLYMDTNHEHGAEHIYRRTVEGLQLRLGSKYYPKGIVAGAFELGPDLWMQRNVAARLIAVAMGAAQLNFTNSDVFWGTYNRTCRDSLGLEASVCDLQGFVAVSKLRYQKDWKRAWNEWTSTICERLTEPSRKLTMSRITSNAKTTFSEANQYFWSTLKVPVKNRTRVLRHDPKLAHDLKLAKTGTDLDSQRTATTTGVLLDLVNSMQPTAQTIELLEKYIAPLGITLAQLRLADNHGFAIGLEHLTRVQFSPLATFSNSVPPAQDFVNLVRAAADLGIEVYPEITLSTNAGGWVDAGYALDCSQAFCNATSATQRIMANDIGQRHFLPVVYSAIRELMEIFSTSRYIHLGSDERKSHAACFLEDGRYQPDEELPFASFEKHLSKLLREHMGVTTQHIIRWENDEQIHYPGRAGDITHHRSTAPFTLPKVRQGEPFFVTLDILVPPSHPQENGKVNPLSPFYEIYIHTRELMALKPLGIMAEIRNLDEALWLTHHVGLRLMSFSLGTRSDLNDYSLEEFREHLANECRRANFDNCEEINKNPTESTILVPRESFTYFVESDNFVKRVCDQQTVVMVSRKAKDIVL